MPDAKPGEGDGQRVDIAIVGSGFAGSLLAMILRRLGRSVVLVERGHHPRFAIGESSTPLASLLLESLAERYDLPRLLPFAKYGSWKRECPEVACGLKRGFSFFRHEVGEPFAPHADRRNQLLVAASPSDDVADVHWYRPDLDHFLVRQAVALGARYIDRTDITSFAPPNTDPTGQGYGRLAGTRVSSDGTIEPVHLSAHLVVDATGPRGWLHRVLGLGERTPPGLPATQALYSHFTGVRRMTDVVGDAFAGAAPFVPDAAAVHHVFDGGWLWVLRFDNGITSAGVAATDPLARELSLKEGAPAWLRLMERYPSIGKQFADAARVRDFTWTPRLSFMSDTIADDGWLMLPSAAGIVDPLLSTGFPLTLLGVERVVTAVADHWGTARLGAELQRYAERTASELDVTSRLVGALYDAFGDWERFTALSFLYFAAASFAESTRRLGKANPAEDTFLLASNPTFGPALNRCLGLAAILRETPDGPECGASAGTDAYASVREDLLAAIAEAIAPVNVTGLSNPARANWYPCDATDMLRGAGKLGADQAEVFAMLKRCGFTLPRAAV